MTEPTRGHHTFRGGGLSLLWARTCGGTLPGHAAVVEELKRAKQQLAAEQQLTAFLRRTTVELSIEVENLRREQEDVADATVVHMPRPRGPRRRFSPTDPGS
ncbi:hypothetical protein [Streptomyces sp. NPDC050355]|uniref:hypothetical protein n=1 Tax=Streptomyces sp. NPDC050355 TaxID=3365609 RepID=UPI0037AF12B2